MRDRLIHRIKGIRDVEDAVPYNGVENGERKTNLNKNEENLPRLRGRFSTLKCVSQCGVFTQRRML